MGSTYVALTVHIIFSTKGRRPLITAELQPKLHDYLAGTLTGLRAKALAVGGIEDHVHLLASLRSDHCVAALVRETKKASTQWMRDSQKVADFGWQDGYAAIAVSPERVAAIGRYVHHQAEHHRQHDSRDELLAILRQAGIEPVMEYFE